MNFKKFLPLLLIVGLMATMLSACSSADEEKPSKKAQTSHKFPLVYYEVLQNGEHEDARVEFGYKTKDGKLDTVSTKPSHIYEHILKDGNEEPYIQQDSDYYHIYRQPYMTYGDESFEGVVEGKKEVKKDDQ